MAHYGDASLFVSGLIEVALTLWEDNLWAACDSLMGVGEKIKAMERRLGKSDARNSRPNTSTET